MHRNAALCIHIFKNIVKQNRRSIFLWVDIRGKMICCIATHEVILPIPVRTRIRFAWAIQASCFYQYPSFWFSMPHHEKHCRSYGGFIRLSVIAWLILLLNSSVRLTLVSHSQITMTLHPICSKAAVLLLSLSMLRFNFLSQYSALATGRIFACLQVGQPCQKQPCTNITVLYFGRTISGLPGKSFLCSRKR